MTSAKLYVTYKSRSDGRLHTHGIAMLSRDPEGEAGRTLKELDRNSERVTIHAAMLLRDDRITTFQPREWSAE